MNAFFTYLISGLAIGASFALIANGFVVVYRVTRVINFTQGTIAVIGGLAAGSFLKAGLPQGLSEFLAIIVAGIAGLLIGIIATGKAGISRLTSLIITLGLAIGFYALEIVIWGENPRSFNMLTGTVKIFGSRVQDQYLLIIGVAFLIFGLLAFFFSKTYLGKALTACSLNPYAARLVGLKVRNMGFLSFAIAGLLGGLGGVLIAPLQSVAYNYDLMLGVNGFAAAVLGDVMSPALALVGGITIGLAESFVAGYYNAADQTAIALIFMIFLMVWRARHRVSVVEEIV